MPIHIRTPDRRRSGEIKFTAEQKQEIRDRHLLRLRREKTSDAEIAAILGFTDVTWVKKRVWQLRKAFKDLRHGD
jgi:hypothetical protein